MFSVLRVIAPLIVYKPLIIATEDLNSLFKAVLLSSI